MQVNHDKDRISRLILPWVFILGLLGYIAFASDFFTATPPAPAHELTDTSQHAKSTAQEADDEEEILSEKSAEELAINQSGAFVKKLLVLPKTSNAWTSIKRNNKLTPELKEQLDNLAKHLQVSAQKVEILYSDYVKNGKSNPDNSKILAVRVQRGKNQTNTFFAYKEKNETLFFDMKGDALDQSMDRMPLAYRRISSPFDLARKHPVTRRVQPHKGIDLKADYGAAVKTTGDGYVVFSGWQGGYGRVVKINHPNGYQTVYAHLSATTVNTGEHVKRGQIIGKVGNSGITSGTHLHYEVHVNGVPTNPQTVKLPSAQSLPKSQRKTWTYYAKLYLNTMDELANQANKGTAQKLAVP